MHFFYTFVPLSYTIVSSMINSHWFEAWNPTKPQISATGARSNAPTEWHQPLGFFHNQRHPCLITSMTYQVHSYQPKSDFTLKQKSHTSSPHSIGQPQPNHPRSLSKKSSKLPITTTYPKTTPKSALLHPLLVLHAPHLSSLCTQSNFHSFEVESKPEWEISLRS